MDCVTCEWAFETKTCPSQPDAVCPRADLAAHAHREPCALNEARRTAYDELALDALVPWATSKAQPSHHSTSKLWDSAFSMRTRQVTAVSALYPAVSLFES